MWPSCAGKPTGQDGELVRCVPGVWRRPGSRARRHRRLSRERTIGSDPAASTRGFAVDGPGPMRVRCGTASGVVAAAGLGTLSSAAASGAASAAAANSAFSSAIAVVDAVRRGVRERWLATAALTHQSRSVSRPPPGTATSLPWLAADGVRSVVRLPVDRVAVEVRVRLRRTRGSSRETQGEAWTGASARDSRAYAAARACTCACGARCGRHRRERRRRTRGYGDG